MPKSLYKVLKKSNPDGDIVVSDSKRQTLFYSSKQITRHFLCNECEHIFNVNGENLVIPECYKNDTNFPLKEKVKNANSFRTHDTERWIQPTEIANFTPENYLYFAASIVWRGSAWPTNIGNYKNSLGKLYQDQFRKYLLGESPFPENAFLTVSVDTGQLNYPMTKFPAVFKKEGFRNHIFFIPGIKFCISVGSNMNKLKKITQSHNSSVLVIDYDFEKHSDFKVILNQVTNQYTATGKLAKESNV